MADVQNPEDRAVHRAAVIPVRVEYYSDRPLPWRIHISSVSPWYYDGLTLREAWELVPKTATEGAVLDEIAELVYFQGEILEPDAPHPTFAEREPNPEAELAELRADRQQAIEDRWDRENEGRWDNYVPDEEDDLHGHV